MSRLWCASKILKKILDQITEDREYVFGGRFELVKKETIDEIIKFGS
jgi:hypothetical protein